MAVPVSAGIAAEPLAVWDVRDNGGVYWTHCAEAHTWAMTHLGDRGRYTYRMEFYDADPPFAVVHRFAADAGGRKFNDPQSGKAAIVPPAVEVLDELPPAHLLGR